MASVTPEQALNHPTWKMGKRITIDSATLMNKGFEVIEACWLFDFPPKDVEVVVHPESKVHALVEYLDGSVIAQVCATDMRMPIQYALTYPERAAAPVPRLDWSKTAQWSFEPPDYQKFPLLGWLTKRFPRADLPPRRSMRPMRSPWRRFWPETSHSLASQRLWPSVWNKFPCGSSLPWRNYWSWTASRAA